jgi:hypothetical protein
MQIDVLEVDGNYYGMCFNEFWRVIVYDIMISCLAHA